MPNTIYVTEAVNIFCGDHDPEQSKHLTISELGLPTLEETAVDHSPGGGKVAVEFTVGVNKLEPSFKLAGFDPALLTSFGLGSKKKNVFSAYGVMIDKLTGRNIELKAIIEGRLGKVEPSAFQRGELHEHDYAIKEVMHYELWFDEEPKVKWDFFENTWEIDGNNENAELNRILRIPSSV